MCFFFHVQFTGKLNLWQLCVPHLLFPVAADCHDGQDERLDGCPADHPRPDPLKRFPRRGLHFRRRGELASSLASTGGRRGQERK
jgi:hypothetical protein